MPRNFKLLSLSVLAFIFMSADNKIRVEKFRFKEFDKVKKTLKFQVYGQKGTQDGKEVRLEGVKIIMINDRDPLTITTSSCLLDTQSKTCTSPSEIEVKGQNIKMTGKGYDLDNKSQKIFIRSKVKVIWKKTK